MLNCADPESWGPASSARWDLTPCFEEGIVFPAVHVLFIFAAAWRIWVLSHAIPLERTAHSRKLLTAKLVRCLELSWVDLAGLTDLTQALLLPTIPLSAANVGLAFVLSVPLPSSYILELITFVLAPVLTYLSHTRIRTSSTPLLLFWPAYLCGIFLWSRTLVVYTGVGPLRAVLALRCALAGLGLSAFAIEYVGPEWESDLKSKVEGGPKESEIVIANVYQRWTFSWLTTLMRKGAKAYVTEEDLPALVPTDEAARLGDVLRQKLAKQ